MRRIGQVLTVLTASLTLLTGCLHPKPRFKPPPIKEEYVSAPDDPRYNEPEKYPKNVLNKGLIKRSGGADENGGGRPGAGPSGGQRNF